MNTIFFGRINIITSDVMSWLNEINNKIYILTPDEFYRNEEKEKLKEHFPNTYFFKNYDKSLLVEYKAIELCTNENIKKIMHFSEVDVIRSARVREKFNILGQNISETIIFRDKYQMRVTLKKLGFEMPIFNKIDNGLDLYDFIGNNGYPVILKPRCSAGSMGIKKINNNDELEYLLNNELFMNEFDSPIEYIAEEFLDLPIYHADGIVNSYGSDFKMTVSEYTIPPLNSFQSSSIGSYMLDDDNIIRKKAQNYMSKIIQEFEWSNSITAFHFEFFYDKNNNDIIILEISCRPGGGGTSWILGEAMSLNSTKAMITSQAGEKYTFNDIKLNDKSFGLFVLLPEKGKLIKFPDKPSHDFIIKTSFRAVTNKVYNGSQSSVDNLAIIVISGVNNFELRKNFQTLEKWYSDRVIWEL